MWLRGKATHLAWQHPRSSSAKLMASHCRMAVLGSSKSLLRTSPSQTQCDVTRVLLLCAVGSAWFQLKVPKSRAWHMVITQLAYKFRASLGSKFYVRLCQRNLSTKNAHTCLKCQAWGLLASSLAGFYGTHLSKAFRPFYQRFLLRGTQLNSSSD